MGKPPNLITRESVPLNNSGAKPLSNIRSAPPSPIADLLHTPPLAVSICAFFYNVSDMASPTLDHHSTRNSNWIPNLGGLGRGTRDAAPPEAAFAMRLARKMSIG